MLTLLLLLILLRCHRVDICPHFHRKKRGSKWETNAERERDQFPFIFYFWCRFLIYVHLVAVPTTTAIGFESPNPENHRTSTSTWMALNIEILCTVHTLNTQHRKYFSAHVNPVLCSMFISTFFLCISFHFRCSHTFNILIRTDPNENAELLMHAD